MPESTDNARPLSSEQLRELAVGRQRLRKIRRAVVMATISGWTLAGGAVLVGFPGVLDKDWWTVAGGGVLAASAFVELRGAEMLKAFEPRGGKWLGWNQICLGLVLAAYFGWAWREASRQPSSISSLGTSGDAELDAMLGWASQLSRQVTHGLYAGMIAGAVLVPGLMSWYYFARVRLVRQFTRETPAWAVEALGSTEPRTRRGKARWN